MHRASVTPYDPPRTPTTKDFAEEGWPAEIGQSSRLSTPDCPKQGSDKVDLLPLHESNQISDNSAGLIRVVRRVGDDRGRSRSIYAARSPISARPFIHRLAATRLWVPTSYCRHDGSCWDHLKRCPEC